MSRYNIVAKCSSGRRDFRKWRTSDLLKFTRFLDANYPDWKYFNVYDRRTRVQLSSFTKNSKPLTKYVR